MGKTAEAAVYTQIAISFYFTIPKWSFELIMIQLVIDYGARLGELLLLHL